MPSAVRQVGFAESVQFSRPAHDDEVYVMKQFARHASHCTLCSHPFETHIKGGQLCDRGHAYAKDVAKYIYSKAGKAFSKLERRGDDAARVQVELPRDCEVIRDLLRAVDHGLRLPKNKPVISHDPTYHVPDRRSVEHRDQYDVEVRAPKSHTVPRAEPKTERKVEKVYIKGRGSLYKKDEEERRRRSAEEEEKPVIYRASPGVRIREYRRST